MSRTCVLIAAASAATGSLAHAPAYRSLQIVAHVSAPRLKTNHYILTHVSIVDTTGGPIKSDMSVEVSGQRIVSVRRFSRLPAARRIDTVDATGKFLIPGLWDMHVHTGERDIYLPLYIANGVTGVRDMGGDLDEPTGSLSARFVQLKLWRAAIDGGRLVGPRMVLAGFLIDGFAWPGDIVATNPAEARDAVRVVKGMGADFIKVKSGLSRDAYFAIADEAKRQHMTVAGHIPDAVRAIDACKAGQHSVEHLTGVAVATSLEERALDDDIRQAFASRDRVRYDNAVVRAADSFDAKTAHELFACFARERVWQVPTLVELRSSTLGDDDPTDPHRELLPSSLRTSWKVNRPKPNGGGAKLFAHYLGLTRAMHAAQVEFMTGTDSANPSIVPGFALHDELALFVEAGFTPMQALQAATINPARFLGKEKQLGTIDTGKLADMVLLDANPLLDIRNTRMINAVIVNGRFFSRDELDAMLAGVRAITSRD